MLAIRSVVKRVLTRRILSQTRRDDAKHTEVCGLSAQRGNWKNLVGLSGLEPPTSPLSGVRSNHLSYKPAGVLRSSLISSDNLCEHFAGRYLQVRR